MDKSRISAEVPDWSREAVRRFWDPGQKLMRALRRYQETRGLRVSGYLDEQTVVRLLADGVLGND